MTQKGYPFIFIGEIFQGTDDLLLSKYVFRFLSAKSGLPYTVHIEKYVNNLYGIKFKLDIIDSQLATYSYRTNTYEARKIFLTVVDIALDVLAQDGDASFFLVGSSDEKDKKDRPTRRFRVYRSFLKYLSTTKFEKYDDEKNSFLILVNNVHSSNYDAYLKPISDFIGASFSLTQSSTEPRVL
jgi:hypothetical protein